MSKHLDDEEFNAVPIIENTSASTSGEPWSSALAFLTSHPRLAMVLGGLVLDYATPDERLTFMSGVPLVPRLLMRFLSPRMTASYRRRLYAAA